MLGQSFSRAHAIRRPRLYQVAVLALASTTLLMSQQTLTQAQAQKPGNPTPSAKPPQGKPGEEKPQPKPDESAPATAALMQLNNALEGLAAKASPAVVQILVTGYGTQHEESRQQ